MAELDAPRRRAPRCISRAAARAVVLFMAHMETVSASLDRRSFRHCSWRLHARRASGNHHDGHARRPGGHPGQRLLRGAGRLLRSPTGAPADGGNRAPAAATPGVTAAARRRPVSSAPRWRPTSSSPWCRPRSARGCSRSTPPSRPPASTAYKTSLSLHDAGFGTRRPGGARPARLRGHLHRLHPGRRALRHERRVHLGLVLPVAGDRPARDRDRGERHAGRLLRLPAGERPLQHHRRLPAAPRLQPHLSSASTPIRLRRFESDRGGLCPPETYSPSRSGPGSRRGGSREG